jgi:hypothetical protein
VNAPIRSFIFNESTAAADMSRTANVTVLKRHGAFRLIGLRSVTNRSNCVISDFSIQIFFLIETSFTTKGPPLWCSGHSSFLQIRRSRVRFPALPDFLRSSESGTGSTQPREYN